MLMHVTRTTLHCKKKKKIRAQWATGDLKPLENVNGFDSCISILNHFHYSKTI